MAVLTGKSAARCTSTEDGALRCSGWLSAREGVPGWMIHCDICGQSTACVPGKHCVQQYADMDDHFESS